MRSGYAIGELFLSKHGKIIVWFVAETPYSGPCNPMTCPQFLFDPWLLAIGGAFVQGLQPSLGYMQNKRGSAWRTIRPRQSLWWRFQFHVAGESKHT